MCAANCPGVDPNSVIGGGVAAVALSGLAGQALLGPALGVGGLTLAGGAAAMGMFNCQGDTPCRVIIQVFTSDTNTMFQTVRGCRPLIRFRGRLRCPRFTG